MGEREGKRGPLVCDCAGGFFSAKPFARGERSWAGAGLVGLLFVSLFFISNLFLFLFDFPVLNFKPQIKHPNEFKTLLNFVLISVLLTNTIQSPQ